MIEMELGSIQTPGVKSAHTRQPKWFWNIGKYLLILVGVIGAALLLDDQILTAKTFSVSSLSVSHGEPLVNATRLDRYYFRQQVLFYLFCILIAL